MLIMRVKFSEINETIKIKDKFLFLRRLIGQKVNIIFRHTPNLIVVPLHEYQRIVCE